MDLEFEDPRPRYRNTQLAFGLIALSLALLSFATAFDVGYVFTRNPKIAGVMERPEWLWLVNAPITWVSLIGSYLLVGRWTESTWQRRAGLLVVMNSIDAVLWTLSHAHQFGLLEHKVGHFWLRMQIASGLGWLELMLIASMATDVSLHLGKNDAPDAFRSARSLCMIGLGLWLFMLIGQTDWFRWPLRPRRFDPQGFLLFLGSLILTTVASFQTTALSIIAARQCQRFGRELDRREWDHELLRPRSESENDKSVWS
jgi:hypothetical protein